MPLPPNFGFITIPDGALDGVRFWLRVFQLEAYVNAAQADIQARPEVAKASVPIIADYTAGRIYFYYAIVLFIDSLGLSSGVGIIYFADEEHWAAANEKRDSFADHIMKGIQERVEEGKMTGTMLTIDPGKE